MATLTLKKHPAAAPAAKRRAPLRGSGTKPRPTLAQAQAERAQRAERPERPERAEPMQRDERTRPTERAKPRAAAVKRPPPAPGLPAAPAPAPIKAAPAQAALQSHAPGSLRLSKLMSELGLASRREADEWIERGWVRVDGEVVAELGARVLPTQQVSIDRKARTQQAQRVTVLLNKPVGYVSGQAEDGYEPASVLVTPANHWREDASGQHFQREHLRHLAPAGRLDIDSVGLLVLTQDGRIAKQLIGEDSAVEKEYLVRVQAADGHRLSDEGLRLLNHGLELDGEPLRPARVEWVNDDQLRFVLVEGKKRQIRRMCEAVGLKVTGLKRVRIGRVMLGDLPAGKWRYLGADESFA